MNQSTSKADRAGDRLHRYAETVERRRVWKKKKAEEQEIASMEAGK
jgi:hypothetical protein